MYLHMIFTWTFGIHLQVDHHPGVDKIWYQTVPFWLLDPVSSWGYDIPYFICPRMVKWHIMQHLFITWQPWNSLAMSIIPLRSFGNGTVAQIRGHIVLRDLTLGGVASHETYKGSADRRGFLRFAKLRYPNTFVVIWKSDNYLKISFFGLGKFPFTWQSVCFFGRGFDI